MTARHDEPGAHGYDDEYEFDDEDGYDDERDPDDVPEVNAWLTMVIFGLFVVTTVACYFLLDGWH